MKKIKTIVNILKLIALITFILSIIFDYKQNNSIKLYQCKIVDTFRGFSGLHSTKERFIADIYIIKLNKITTICSDLESYHNLTKYKGSDKIIELYFNKNEILKITNQTNYSNILLVSSLLLLVLIFIIRSVYAEEWLD